MTDTIQTERLLLRPFAHADAQGLHALFVDPELMRFGSRPPHTEIDQTLAVLARAMDDNAAGRGDNLAVFMAGQFVGYAGIWRNDEVGFMFARAVWGTGVAFEALSAVIERARSRGHRTVTADVDPGNVRSLGLLKKLGFFVTGEAKNTWKIGETWVDSVYLARAL